MFGIETLGGTTQAFVLVGAVFLEAIALYLGYGGLVRALEPRLREVIVDA